MEELLLLALDDKKGKIIFAPMPNKTIEVEISNPVFIDPNNERLNA